MIKRILLPFLLALTLASCSVTAPPRDNAQWTTDVHGVSITWRWTEPGGLGEPVADGPNGFRMIGGRAHVLPGSSTCVIDLDPAVIRQQLTRVAAHEAGHCLQARYLRLFADPQSADPYTHQIGERWAEAYAQAYLWNCGQSLRALGWRDSVTPSCAAPPHPNDIPFDL